METKKCSKCKEVKELKEFNKHNKSKDGLEYRCKSCNILYYNLNKDKYIKKDKKEYLKKYNEKNKELIKSKNQKNIFKLKEYRKNYYKINKDKKIKNKNYEKNYYYNNKEKILEYGKIWRIYNKDNLKQKRKEKYNSDILFRLSVNLRNSISISFKKILKNGKCKSKKTKEILGCSFEDFKIYIECQFLNWMDFNNYGLYNGEFNYGWDLDHIIPISSAKTEDDLIKLNHYTNFQPLCSKINREIKRNLLEY